MEIVRDQTAAFRARQWILSELGEPSRGPSALVPSRFTHVAQILGSLRRPDGSSVRWDELIERTGYLLGPWMDGFDAAAPDVEADEGDLKGSRIRDFADGILAAGGDKPVWIFSELEDHAPTRSFGGRSDWPDPLLVMTTVAELPDLPWSARTNEDLLVRSPGVWTWAEDRSWLLAHDQEYECMWLGGDPDLLEQMAAIPSLEIRLNW